MRHILCALCVLCLMTLPVSAQDNAPMVENAGPLVVIGGNNASVQTSSVLDLADSTRPIIAEDYTATWCENCVYAEHSLDEVGENNSVVQFHFHPEIDGQDPFGTAEGDQWWERRYGDRRAPTVVFDGKWIHLGSSPKIGDTLTEDYLTSISSKFEMQGQLEYTWTPSENGGLVSWVMSPAAESDLIEQGFTFAYHLFILEDSAYFPDGSNGVENYPHIVSQITDLGTDFEGNQTITLPQAYDDDDLLVYLVMELIPPQEIENISTPSGAETYPVAVIYSAIGGGVVIIGLLVLLLLRKSKNPPLPTEPMQYEANMVQQQIIPQQQQGQINQYQQMP